uniref:Transforming growth factor beta 1 induced transcript 1 n=1 Tax=Sus scrofa TaxID=9823 RepID=A0A8W4F813_PIG
MPRSGALKERPPEPLTSPLPQMGSGESSGASGDKDHLYSTVCKPRSPKPAAPAAPPFSSSCGVLGTGLCELDRLLQELNATQFNITDEIMSQFPSSKESAGEKKEDPSEDKKRPSPPPSPTPVLPKPSATSATLELDRLMASLSDFRVQNHLPASGPTQPAVPSSVNEGSPSPPGPTSQGSLDTMLGLLQSDLSRRGVPTQAKGLCGSCNKPIAGQVSRNLGREGFRVKKWRATLSVPLHSPQKMVTALGTHWHPEHFCCVSCGEPFGDEGFHEREGRPYCRRDFLQLFAPRCQGCQGPILDNYISALSALWHPDCFVCRVRGCGGAAWGGRAHGGRDYGPGGGATIPSTQPAETRLRLCGRLGRGRPGCEGLPGYSARKASYLVWSLALIHPFAAAFPQECFAPFSGGSFFEHEGRPLCENHFHARRGSLCATCGLPVTGRCVSALGRRFHPDHFTCTFCLRPLTKGSFQERAGKPYCQPCFLKLFG